MPFTPRRTGSPRRRCSDSLKTRKATCGSRPSRQRRTALRVGNTSARRVRDLAHLPGLPPLKDDLPRSFGEDASGQVWIGFNRGLGRYAQGRFTLFTEREGLPPGAIMDIHVDRSGRVWLASARGGLVRVDDAGAKRPAFVALHDGARAVEQQCRGHRRRRGRAPLRRRRARPRPLRPRCQAASSISPPLTVWRRGSSRAAFRDRKGVLWVGMHGGLARLAPTPEKPPAPPQVLIRATAGRGGTAARLGARRTGHVPS